MLSSNIARVNKLPPLTHHFKLLPLVIAAARKTIFLRQYRATSRRGVSCQSQLAALTGEVPPPKSLTPCCQLVSTTRLDSSGISADLRKKKFQVQLAPFVKELTEDGSATFHFIHGPCKAVPPEGFEEYFGKPPYFRFIEPDRDVEKTHQDDVLARIRDFPDCETPEDTMRELMREGIATTHRSTDNALKYLLRIMQERGPFDAIIGYSEGATVAATLLLHEQRRFKKKGIKPMFKYAIFFAGWPPVDPDTHAMILSDESDATIEIPTCHIIGSLDPYVHGSLALYNVCDPDTAYLFDHAKGHTLPRDRETVKELGDVVRGAIKTYGIH